jgi:hypothetical protein
MLGMVWFQGHFVSFISTFSDCLDNGNNKKALQEADKVLKKQKDLQCARVSIY